MQIDDPFERTPDLVSKIRKLREAAEKETNRFTSVADYDVRRVVGQKPKAERMEEAVAPSASASGRTKRKLSRPSSSQVAIEFPSALVEGREPEEVNE